MKVLIVEDEDAIAEPLAEGLRREGFTVERAATGEAALEASGADLVLLDLGLPDLDGFAVCRELRTRSDVPIIMVTAKGEEVDRVVGLELGADDYIVKPFGFRELLARIRAVTRSDERTVARRGARASARSSRRARPARPRRRRGARPDAEGVRPPGAPRTRARRGRLAQPRSSQEVWHTTWYGRAKTIDVHVASLRKKLGDPSLDRDRARHRPSPATFRVSRSLLSSYLTLTLVVLAALEIPLGDPVRAQRAAAT